MYTGYSSYCHLLRYPSYKTCKCITSEPVHKPAAIGDQHLDQNIAKCIIHQIKRDNMRNNYMADEVVAFCTNLYESSKGTLSPSCVI